jgi:hypothetical protein
MRLTFTKKLEAIRTGEFGCVWLYNLLIAIYRPMREDNIKMYSWKGYGLDSFGSQQG